MKTLLIVVRAAIYITAARDPQIRDYWDHILGIDKPAGGSVIFVYVYAPSFN
jgi:hypothetical protein